MHVLFHFFLNDPATTEIYTLSLHDALPIYDLALLNARPVAVHGGHRPRLGGGAAARSEEHTSELQSRPHLVCRLLLEKKNTERRETHGNCTEIMHINRTTNTQQLCLDQHIV